MLITEQRAGEEQRGLDLSPPKGSRPAEKVINRQTVHKSISSYDSVHSFEREVQEALTADKPRTLTWSGGTVFTMGPWLR